MVMADRGFDIQHLLSSKCVTLNKPPFLQGKEQLSLEEEGETQEVLHPYVFMWREQLNG